MKYYMRDEIPKFLEEKVVIGKRNGTHLETESILVTTNCIVNEIQQKGEEFSGAFVLARRFERAGCKHDTPVSSMECLKSLLGKWEV
jgi:hypothetical protein